MYMVFGLYLSNYVLSKGLLPRCLVIRHSENICPSFLFVCFEFMNNLYVLIYYNLFKEMVFSKV